MVNDYDPLRIKTWNTPDGKILRIAETRLDLTRKVGRVHYTILELKKSGRYLVHEETQTNRFFLIDEMMMFVSDHGFEPVKWYAGYTPDERISDSTWHILAVARRK
jgi:hypothetical protein